MAHYVYIFSDYTHTKLHSGYCEDVNKLIGNYAIHEDLRLLYPLDKYLLRLVYLEELSTEGAAIDRNMYFTFMPLSEKVKIIESVNPEWLELAPGVNIEL